MKFKNLLVGALLTVSAFSMLADAVARPMGGGRSFGRQSGSVSRMAPAPAAPRPSPAATPAPSPAPGMAPGMAAPRPPSPWRGIIGGALVGLGLGALMSHMGIGGMFGSLLMIILLVLVVGFVLRLLRGNGSRNVPMRPVAAPFSGNAQLNVIPMPNVRASEPVSLNPAPSYAAPAAALPHTPWGVPADFDAAFFLRHAKANFIRLQAAWDKGDAADLHEFTTPEVYAELKLQMQERGAQADFTDVVSLDAELLGIETTATDYLASVRFNALIKDAPAAPALPFQEVWNLSKPTSGATGWMLAGIQQLA
ncbi:Tim44 domain-containing protein [Rugamonas sp.]|uniref:Tim44 domain-containing protein n=1 Tax=Rugamonas sp. TaxID=1926287 RepID=UPI0025FCCC27|nr:Tim44-like domain-containing protein [Rugamonas sp.]